VRVFRTLLLLGILLRLLFVLIAGKAVQPPWSSGGDVTAYVTLAGNLVHGRGYTYSGQPTALRPPLYPLLLAGCMMISPRFWPVVLRLLQFLLGLATAFLGARAAKKLWGVAAGRAALLLALYCPTLVYPTSTVSPEALGAFLVAVVFCFAVENLEKDSQPALAGISVGMATLAKEISPALGIPFVLLYLGRRSFRALLTILVASIIVITPWTLRNYLVFGTPVLSTLGGYGLVDALTNPQGRSQAGEASRTRALLGWGLGDYERDNRNRSYPPEVQMDAAAQKIWLRLVRKRPLELVRNLPAKLSWFWLSTDILFYSRWYSPAVQLGRAAMVFIWWGYLVLAAMALVRLRRQKQRGVFWLFVGWLALVTAVHIPFAMSTRLRIAFCDLPVAVLGSCWLAKTNFAHCLLGVEPGGR
jgi:4-amino-4-deoxy-L-arabinose transferase-like glycosyltransferase